MQRGGCYAGRSQAQAQQARSRSHHHNKAAPGDHDAARWDGCGSHQSERVRQSTAEPPSLHEVREPTEHEKKRDPTWPKPLSRLATEMTKGAPPPPTNRDYPVYPEITRAQWEVLVAWTDQRCAHMMDAADFIADLSPEAREFLREAGPEQIKRINNSLDFFTNSKAVWRFFWIGGGVLLGFVAGAAQIWKTFSEYFMVKLK